MQEKVEGNGMPGKGGEEKVFLGMPIISELEEIDSSREFPEQSSALIEMARASGLKNMSDVH